MIHIELYKLTASGAVVTIVCDGEVILDRRPLDYKNYGDLEQKAKIMVRAHRRSQEAGLLG